MRLRYRGGARHDRGFRTLSEPADPAQRLLRRTPIAMVSLISVRHVRLLLAVVLAFAFAGMCAVATYGYLDHRPALAVAR